jgi:hypothetical protein
MTTRKSKTSSKPSSKSAQKKPKGGQSTRPVRPKLDPRLAFILSLPANKMKTLKEHETGRLKHVADEIDRRLAAREEQQVGKQSSFLRRSQPASIFRPLRPESSRGR